MESQKGYLYILTNKGKNVLYVGSTKYLVRRIKEHKKGYKNGFTKKYNVNQLVHYETFDHVKDAKQRKKQIKGWKRERKIALIESKNKRWKNLYYDLIRDPSLRSGFRNKKYQDSADNI